MGWACDMSAQNVLRGHIGEDFEKNGTRALEEWIEELIRFLDAQDVESVLGIDDYTKDKHYEG